MKKTYLTILASVFALGVNAQYGQIQNGGFENWTIQEVYDYPTTWGSSNENDPSVPPTTFRSTDAFVGTYSAEIHALVDGPNQDTLFGFVFHGSVGQAGPDGGIPFTTTFNTVNFQYKCDFPVANDSIYLYVIRFVGGVPIEFSAIPAVGGTHNTWTQGSVTLPATPQDELFIGFVMGDPMNNNFSAPGSWARFDDVELFNNGLAVTNVPDPSFEDWATETTENPDNWFTPNELMAALNAETVTKTTDAFAGQYAAELKTAQHPINGDTIPGVISVGPFNFSGGFPFVPAPYTGTPTMINGMYKFSPVGGDIASLQIQFLQNGAQIGMHVESFTNPTMGYTSFSSPLVITGQPDSIIFLVFSGDNPGSVLKLDELAFSGGNVGLDEFNQMNVSIYPNPASDVVMIKSDGIYAYSMVDMCGKVVHSGETLSGAQAIDLGLIPSGSYFIQIESDTRTETHKLIVE